MTRHCSLGALRLHPVGMHLRVGVRTRRGIEVQNERRTGGGGKMLQSEEVRAAALTPLTCKEADFQFLTHSILFFFSFWLFPLIQKLDANFVAVCF